MLAIETKNLNKKTKEKDILKDVNLKINEGDIYGFIGRNGAGKSTTLKIICDLCKASSGEVLIYGKGKR